MRPVPENELAQLDDPDAALTALHARIAPRFRRREVRERVYHYLAGLIGPIPRRTGRQLAAHTGEPRPDGMQRLLTTARWDPDALRDDLQAYVVEHFADPQAVLVIAEMGFKKRGTASAGVARQEVGASGQPVNCQLGVFLGYVSRFGTAFLDRALYLPPEWHEDTDRRKRAHIPEGAGTQSKGQIARTLLERACAASVPHAWVVTDAPYGSDGDLRAWLARRRRPYVLEILATDEPLMHDDQGHPVRIADLLARIPGDDWQSVAPADSARDPYRWARVPLPYDDPEGWERWLLVRRHPAGSGNDRFFRTFHPTGTRLEDLVRVASARRTIEEAFRQARSEVGIDQYEVRRWDAWHRHMTLALLAQAFLEVQRASEHGECGDRARSS